MKDITRNAVVAVLAATCLALPHAAFAQNASRGAQADDNQTVTITGCLSVNPAARMYILTTTPSDLSRAGGAVANEPTTITYQLLGGEGLQDHVGDKIEVTGLVEPETTTTAKSKDERSGPPRNAQQEEDKPTVKTKTEAKIRAQALRVQNFRFVESNCKPTGGR